MRVSAAKLTNGETVTFGDFNVITGGNGVGKTTMLAELYDRVCGISRSRFYWVQEPDCHSTDLAADVGLLRTSLSRRWEGSNYFYFSSATKSKDGQVDLDNSLRFNNEEATQPIDTLPKNLLSDKKYRRPFVTYLGCDARLGLPNEVALAPLNQPPQDPINVLARNRQLLNSIDKTLHERFQFHFVLLDHIRTQLLLGTSRQNPPKFDVAASNQQGEYERIEKWKAEWFFPIQEAGHGIRSMIRLLTAIHEPVNRVILIDEPEMHLAASQKRWLGKELIALSAQQKKQVFLVTHDPLVLQGVLDAAATTNVFRLDRDSEGAGRVRTCQLEPPDDMTAAKNQDQYLQGLFYQRCVVVEGASDRSFYQNFVDRCKEALEQDTGFVACSGKGSTKHMASIVSKVGVRAAFIYDLDALLDFELLRDVYRLKGGADDPLEPMLHEVPEAIRALADSGERLKRLKQLLGYSEKTGFTSAWAAANATAIGKSISTLKGQGVFVVPCGTLESWAPDVEPKVRFAELAPPRVTKDEALRNPLDAFLCEVLAYLGVETQQVIPAVPPGEQLVLDNA